MNYWLSSMKTQGKSYSWNFSQFSADPYQNKVCPDNTVVGVGDGAGVGVAQGSQLSPAIICSLFWLSRALSAAN